MFLCPSENNPAFQLGRHAFLSRQAIALVHAFESRCARIESALLRSPEITIFRHRRRLQPANFRAAGRTLVWFATINNFSLNVEIAEAAERF